MALLNRHSRMTISLGLIAAGLFAAAAEAATEVVTGVINCRSVRWSGLSGQLLLSAKLEPCGCRLGVCGQRGSVVQASPRAKRHIHSADGPGKDMRRGAVA
jgi:hypothetical protein